ncbi:ribosomal protein S18 acetylase RimI-like enzyme [Arcanobacterium wilhelmae]|uniref:Ribosomal protein S18 acetylase RimI-like enzyme n=1 Tax=Arcanobacterium wilhelmae TaxID=1803177 RepID=A0ABT9N8Y1_9ACTO|nr:GNAT family N-acetyltransferase [Arcanobacterium wilhelmae]MDP9800162.1 ribosomal protein S18 acetylase RimI-like enzyme [Arcanobacterium wilhelmae]WFN89602.1 GNAT family N-acetyltransferase [Arcanobacterium wilhelmae]
MIAQRALTLADSAALTKLITACEAAERSQLRTTGVEVQEYFSPGAAHRIQGFFAGPTLVAFSMVRFHDPSSPQMTMSGAVHPDFRRRGIGEHVVRHSIEASSEIASECGLSAWMMRMYVDRANTDLESLLRSFAFHPRESIVSMRKLVGVGEAPELAGAYLRIADLDSAMEEDVARLRRAVFNDAGAWESAGLRWRFGAVDEFSDRPRLVGYLLASRVEGWAAPEALVEELVVEPEWQRRRVGARLLAAAQEGFASEGIGAMSLDLDADSPVYDSFIQLGFSPVAAQRAWDRRFSAQ